MSAGTPPKEPAKKKPKTSKKPRKVSVCIVVLIYLIVHVHALHFSCFVVLQALSVLPTDNDKSIAAQTI